MQRYAATCGVPDALLFCRRYAETLPPGAIQSCHLNESGLDCQIERSAAAWRLRSGQQAVRCGLPVIRERSGDFAERQGLRIPDTKCSNVRGQQNIPLPMAQTAHVTVLPCDNAAMIDLTEKGAEWVERWEEVTFTPSHLFAKTKFKLDSSAFLFASVSLMTGYFAAMFGSAAYFAWYYPKNFRGHLAADDLKKVAEAVTITSGLYVGVVIVVLLFTSAISYLVYRKVGSPRNFRDHFATELHFLNMEPLAAIALTIATINFSNNHWIVAVASLAIFLGSRVYYLFLAYTAFGCLHNLSSDKMKLAFWAGYFPIAIVGVAIQFLIFSLISLFATGNFD
jgi:hypothetical protein